MVEVEASAIVGEPLTCNSIAVLLYGVSKWLIQTASTRDQLTRALLLGMVVEVMEAFLRAVCLNGSAK